MKINKIRIQNFKVFNDFTVDFNKADIIVLDGPNGYGKTTIYDAIELVFTGKIRRYTDLKNKLIDGRQNFLENPFYNENAVGHSIIITIELLKNDKLYILERVANASEITGVLDFSIYKLFTKLDFLSDVNFAVDNEQTYLLTLFGKDYNTNFQFLNYVEQEECLFLLKHSDKTRKNHIGHLFDLKEFDAKIQRIDDIKRKVDLLCNKDRKNELEKLGAEISELQDNISSNVASSDYIKLFEKGEFAWDRENLDIRTINYTEIAGTDGILNGLKTLIERKEIFKQSRINSAANFILENEELLKIFIKLYYFLPRKEEFRIRKIQNSTFQNIVIQLRDLRSTDLEKDIDLSICKFLSVDIIDKFVSEKKDLLRNHEELSGLDKIHSEIYTSRNQLKDKLYVLKDNGQLNGECLLCGYDWRTIEELLNQIDSKSTQLKELNSVKANTFEQQLFSFKSGIVQSLINKISEELYFLEFKDIRFIDELLTIEINQFINVIKAFEYLKIDYLFYLNKEEIAPTSTLIEELKIMINSFKINIDQQFIEPYFIEYFRLYLENKIDYIDLLSVKDIENKKNHLTYLWSLSQSELLQTQSKLLIEKTTKYDDSKIILQKLNLLKNTYSESLKAYQKKIIKDIEVIFHIYSGRIMQSFQGGLGLFIFSEKDGIRFQSNPNKTYDAIFSMSSGQLSALIISFTLALHKKYSLNKIILIDDPVQTMDELNLYGFIDLLRNEFSSDQIIMSTHEDMMSAFMRYKFKSYGLSEKRVNLKKMMEVN